MLVQQLEALESATEPGQSRPVAFHGNVVRMTDCGTPGPPALLNTEINRTRRKNCL